MSEVDGGRSLEDYALDYVRTRRSLREEESEIKALKENSNKAEDLAEYWQKVKDLRAEINGDDRVIKKKTKVNDLKDKLKMLEEMIVLRLKEQELTLFELTDEGNFILNDKLKFKGYRKKKGF